MKCKFVCDVDVDASTLDAVHKSKLKFRETRNRVTGLPQFEAYFSAGTEYEHPNAAFFVDRGMAVPVDGECTEKCKPISQEQRNSLELSYKADLLGINDPKDRDLFFAGVIGGYEPVNGQMAYIKGPNYDAWRNGIAAEKAKQEEEV